MGKVGHCTISYGDKKRQRSSGREDETGKAYKKCLLDCVGCLDFFPCYWQAELHRSISYNPSRCKIGLIDHRQCVLNTIAFMGLNVLSELRSVGEGVRAT